MFSAIVNSQIYSGGVVLKDKVIIIKEGLIYDVCDQLPNQQGIKVVDLKGKNIAAGLIDIQINGGKYSYFSQNPNQESLNDIYNTCLEFGTPFILPTLISCSYETILQALQTVAKFRIQHKGVIGLHLEGPFLNPKRAGAHSLKYIRKPTNEELSSIIQKGKDTIKIITIAPECFTQEQLNLLLMSGINISIGHSDITYEEAQRYFNKGIRLATHLYNAMSGMGHRQCGLVGAILDNPNIYTSIILDGGHCHYAAVRIAYKVKQQKLILMTDSSFLGRYKTSNDWEGLKFKLKDGYFRDENGNLSGAAISMPQACKNAVDNLKISLSEAISMCTHRVALALKMESQIGLIQKGFVSMFVVFDENMNNCKTLIL